MIVFLYKLLLVCICFEEMFANTKYPLTSLKYIVVFLLFYIVLNSKKSNRVFFMRRSMKLFLFVMLYAFLISLPGFLEVDFDGLRLLKQILFIPIFIFLFYNMEKVTCSALTLNKFQKLYVNIMAIYAVANAFFYFIPLPIWLPVYTYWGRISVGYPTIDAVMVGSALMILLYNSNLVFNVRKKIALILIFIFSILSQASGTGMVIVALLLISFALYFTKFGFPQFYNRDIIELNKKSLITALLVLAISISSIIGALSVRNPELMDNLIANAENRFYILINSQESSALEVNTMEKRSTEFKRAQNKYQKSDINKLFGVGYAPVSLMKISSDRVYIEDQFHLNLFTVGYIGTFIYFALLFSMLKLAVRLYGKRLNFYLYTNMVIVIFAISFTSICFSAFGIIGIICLLYVSLNNEIINLQK